MIICLPTAELARVKIDENLKLLNDDYRTERLHAIRDVLVEPLPSHIFYDWMKRHGKIGGQYKFPRVLKKNKLEDWEEFLRELKK